MTLSKSIETIWGLISREELDAAEAMSKALLRDIPRQPDGLHFQGIIACQRRNFAEATKLIGKALRQAPKNPGFLCSMANVHVRTGEFEEAVTKLKRAVKFSPQLAPAHMNLGIALKELGHYPEAVDAYEEAIRLDPRLAQAHYNRGIALREMGMLDQSLACYRKALEVNPDFSEAKSNLIMSLNYSPDATTEEICRAAIDWGKGLTSDEQDFKGKNTKEKERTLRIGYVSADFCNHPVGYFLQRVLSNHNKTNVTVACYSNGTKSDAMTSTLQDNSDLWRSIEGMSDSELADLIFDDNIDILVDLSGHTAGNRLSAFAGRLAPIQVTWLGYFGTTGLRTMDYILADRFVLPDKDDHHYIEKPWKLPNSYLCFSPPEVEVQPGGLPAEKNGYVTFGCFNNRIKITGDTVDIWAKILNAVPNARILLKYFNYENEAVRKSVVEEFEQRGISAERILFEGRTPRDEVMHAYNRIDIALDTVPFGGGTTTAESVWMAVPVVTKRGDRWVGRVSESILNAVGQPEMVAENDDAYVEIATRLASDLPTLADLRSSLRGRSLTSSLFDGQGFTKDLEKAYRAMWTTWCENE